MSSIQGASDALERFLNMFLKRTIRVQGVKVKHKLHHPLLRRLLYTCTQKSGFIPVPVCHTFNITERLKSSSSKDKDNISSSSTLLEDSLSFQEVPLLVKTTNNLFGVGNDIDTQTASRNSRFLKEDSENGLLESDAIAKVVKVHIINSTNLSEVFRYLKLVPTNNVSPSLALNILERVSSLIQDESDNKVNGKTKSYPEFEESVATHTLCMLISRSDNHSDVLAGLQAVASFSLSSDERKKYMDIFVNECLLRISEGKFSLMEICSVIEAFKKAGKEYLCLGDNLWSEIVGRVGEINEENISRVFNLLPCLKASRNVVLRALEQQALNLMPKLRESSVTSILKVLYMIKAQSRKIFIMSSVWLSVNIHQVTENGLRDFLMLAKVLNHMDPKIQKSIEKYVRLKGSHCSDSLLMASLADYLVKFRWRNVTCLESIANFFVKNYGTLTTYNIVSFVEVFSFLNYEPSNAYQVFESLETILTQRFAEFEPEDIIAIMLACVQLQRYPLNFVSKIFRPLFLDRMNYMIGNNEARLRNAHNNLKLLDTALTLECPLYSGPHMYLEKEMAHRRLSRDARLTEICKNIAEQLEELLGGCDKFGECIFLPKLPPTHMYIVDFMVYANKNRQPLPFNSVAGIEKRVAILILLPEHLCYEEHHLTGSQTMRIRHLQLLGFQVVCLEHSVLQEFSKSKSDQLKYLGESLSQAVITSNSPVIT